MSRTSAELTAKMKKAGRIPTVEAARIAMVSVGTVRAWIEEEKLDGVYYAHQWWVSEKSLRAAMTPLAS